MHIKIMNVSGKKTLFSGEYKSWRETIMDAVNKGANLNRANFSSCDLEGVNFKGTNLQFGCFRDANLISANLANCNLTDANFRHANLRHAKLNNSKLRRVDLFNADIIGADFDGAFLIDINFTKTIIFDANLSGAVMVYGGQKYKLLKNPMQIINLERPVVITENLMSIGEFTYSHAEWEYETIGKASEEFLNKYKEALLALCKLHAEP